MRKSEQLSYSALCEGVETWGEGPPYDVVGVLNLIAAGARNLAAAGFEGTDDDGAAIVEIFGPGDIEVLERVARAYRRSELQTKGESNVE